MSKIEISSPFEEEKGKFEAEIDKVSKMDEGERKVYLESIEAERERLKSRYVEQYGQDEWDKLQTFIEEKFAEREKNNEE